MTELQPITEDREDQIDPAQHGVMAVMNGSGDTKYGWNRNEPVEVELARQTFRRFREKGYNAFKVGRDGRQGEQIREFDPAAEQILFVPQMQGG